ncbi:hypothetical protein [Ilumatobacter sp.]|uniref:hypothetical protein n=1 Tax=Ilumatobacter sp. TaxID=1967498 RepID=UPI003C757BED
MPSSPPCHQLWPGCTHSRISGQAKSTLIRRPCQLQTMLSNRFRKPDGAQRFEKIEFETAFGRPIHSEGGVEPPLHPERAVLAPPAVVVEVRGC